ncbi:MAG: aminotransferase class I/II-fold pyridoxal phosphate-dependent enzyme, partial [Armatimonadetes bacterium]|nr:aminotransferase class I/II-fold pyridoxal phosphate-dependent enzyme [Armatimonadota bacterium]
GWAMGGQRYIEALSRAKSNVDSGTFMAIQRAAIAALERFEEWAPELRRMYQARRDALVSGLQDLGCPIEAPAATFYIWVPVPEGETSESFATRLLADCRVLAIPGAVYGPCGEGFVRMSLTIGAEDPLAAIEQAVANMRAGGITWQ